MLKFLEVLSLIIKLLPLIKEIVMSLETLFPESGAGAQKKAMLNTILDQSIAASTDLAVVYTAAKPTIQAVIDSVVSMMNSAKQVAK